jgi:small subunit ribosomal protein S19
MARSQKKLPFVCPALLRKMKKSSNEGKPIKSYSRNCVITPQMVGYEIQVHNGHKFIPVKIFDNMVGHKLGEFSATRKFTGHPLLKKQKAEATKGKNNDKK